MVVNWICFICTLIFVWQVVISLNKDIKIKPNQQKTRKTALNKSKKTKNIKLNQKQLEKKKIN